MSNSTELLAAVQQVAERGAVVEAMSCNLGDYPGFILGIVWNPSSDRLGFRVKLTTVNYTGMGLLAQVARLFDPLGTAAPMTVKANIKLRALGDKGPEVGRTGCWQ